MTDVIAEQGAAIDGVANPDITVSRLGGAGHLKNAIAKAIADGTASATASRLGAQGRIYAIAGGGEISPGNAGYVKITDGFVLLEDNSSMLLLESNDKLILE